MWERHFHRRLAEWDAFRLRNEARVVERLLPRTESCDASQPTAAAQSVSQQQFEVTVKDKTLEVSSVSQQQDLCSKADGR